MSNSWKQWEGQTIGNCQLQRQLGSSDRGAVFLTQAGGAMAVIKLIHAEGSEANALLARWEVVRGLSHPNVIPILSFGRVEANGLVYVVMEYADESLAPVLAERALEPAEVREMLAPAAEALAWLHRRGLVHSRVHPGNILAVGTTLKVSSDSISESWDRLPDSRTRSLYDAPESGGRSASPAADIWALGITLVETLTQHRPPLGAGGYPQIPDSVPEDFRALARACLEPDPARRCSATQILHRLRGEPEAQSAAKAQSRGAGVPPVVWILLLVVGLVAAVVLVNRSQQPDAQPSAEAAARPTAAAAPASGVPAAEPTKSPEASPEPQELPEPAASVVQPAPQPTPAPRASIAAPAAGGVLHQVLPEVPAQALRTIRGTVKVTVRAQVDENGNVTSAEPESRGSRYFAEYAVQAARQWRFEPARVNGRPAAGQRRIRFQFRRDGVQAGVPE